MGQKIYGSHTGVRGHTSDQSHLVPEHVIKNQIKARGKAKYRGRKIRGNA